MKEKDFLEVVEAVCRRPGLYTPTGSFYESASFLEGYAIGADVHGNTRPHSSFTPFLKWLIPVFQIDDVIMQWPEFRERFSSDAEALENLLVLYARYVNERG
jgi:hypothetical protein